jgi:HAD superfamily hydrolase (TIGR01509 family)
MSKSKFKGAIFDVDDTILDNKPGLSVYGGLHEKSRFLATQKIAKEQGIRELLNITPKENFDAFAIAPVHSMEGAVWNLLFMKGLVASQAIDFDNELLKRIVQAKNEVHHKVVIEEAEEVPGASDFIRELDKQGMSGSLAIASAGILRDILLFLKKYDLQAIIPTEKIKSVESFTHSKPHPEVFELAFASLGLTDSDKKSVIAFEDDPRGIMSAVAAGLTVCAITRRYPREKLEELEIAPDFVIDTYEQAYAVVGMQKN